jgi:hypothetical protein
MIFIVSPRWATRAFAGIHIPYQMAPGRVRYLKRSDPTVRQLQHLTGTFCRQSSAQIGLADCIPVRASKGIPTAWNSGGARTLGYALGEIKETMGALV